MKIRMNHDIHQFFSQGGDGAQDAENCRIAAIADELQRLCGIHEKKSGDGQQDVTPYETERSVSEAYAKKYGLWFPLNHVFELGVPGPSGNENDTYVSERWVYKVNNLFNCGSVISLLRRTIMHNFLFPETSYQFYGFTGFEGRNVYPVLRQVRIANAQPATQIMIDTYMAAIGFAKQTEVGRYNSPEYEVWDILPRNVLVDVEGDIYVVDAEIKRLTV